jgi:hypothetical protein
MSFFFFPKQQTRRQNRSRLGGWYQREREDLRKGWILQKYYVLMYKNGKMRPVETTPGKGEGGIKEKNGECEFN